MTEGIGQDSVTTIIVDSAFFEHLLNCMCNQKYLPTLDRPMSEREKKDQDIIDVAYHKARELQSQNKRNATPLEVIDLRLHRLENQLACLIDDNRPKSTLQGEK